MDLLNLVNNSNSNLEHVMQMVRHFFPYAQEQLGFHKPVMVSFQSDEENANKLLGKTGYYNPDDFSIGIYVDGRHPKDLLRSLSHELIHHTQNCNGDFDSDQELSAGYAQENAAMRDAELDAYKRGNIIFRDFEDLIKKGEINVNIDFKKAGEPKMSLKEWKNNEINTLLMEKWGYGKKANTASEEDLEEADDPLQAAMSDCGDKSTTQDEYDECMKSATPSGKPRAPSVVDAKELEEWRRGYGDPRRKTPGETDGARGRSKYEKGEKPSWLLSPQEKWERDNPEAVRQHKKEFGLDEDCGPMGHEGGEAIDISGPGAEVHVDDISGLSPEEAFAAGMAAAKDAIDQALGGDVPPEGVGALQEDWANPFGPMTDEPSLSPCQDSPDPECEKSLEYLRWEQERDLPPGAPSPGRSSARQQGLARRSHSSSRGGARTSMAPAQEGVAKVSFTLDEARDVARRIFERVKETKR